MFITTAGRTNQQRIEKARKIASDLEAPYIDRRKKAVKQLQQEMNSDCIVVGKEQLELFQKGSSDPFFFHPNSAMFRVKRLMAGEHDPFADAAKLTAGMSLLDCTLGLASDSIVASFLVGQDGRVTGIEGQKYLAYMVQHGLESWDSGIFSVNEAMKRIKVVYLNAYEFLKSLPNDSYDCVYFDPMFEESILESDGIKALGHFAIRDCLHQEAIEEALRVARKRIILKDHYKSSRYEKYQFQVIRRKTAKFHFGYIEK